MEAQNICFVFGKLVINLEHGLITAIDAYSAHCLSTKIPNCPTVYLISAY